MEISMHVSVNGKGGRGCCDENERNRLITSYALSLRHNNNFKQKDRGTHNGLKENTICHSSSKEDSKRSSYSNSRGRGRRRLSLDCIAFISGRLGIIRSGNIRCSSIRLLFVKKGVAFPLSSTKRSAIQSLEQPVTTCPKSVQPSSVS